jgi:zinc protease
VIRQVWSRATGLATALFANVASAQATPTVPPRPTVGPAHPYTFPKITTQVLPNGLRLAVVENQGVPVVAVRVGLQGGSILDVPGKEGSWVLMLNSLREGTTTRTAAEIRDAAADLGTSITVQSPIGFTTARSMWQPALELLADQLQHPTFPIEGVARAQAALASTAGQVSAQGKAQRLLNAQLFGPDHPNARFNTDSSVRRITRDDVIALHTTYMRPQNATIVVYGDVTPPAARAAVEKAFGAWEKGGTTIAASVPAPNATVGQTTIFLRDQPNAAVSVIYTGQLVPSHGSNDAPAVEVVDGVLGGLGAGSRLNTALRVQHGFVYNSSSFPVWRPEPQPGTWQTLLIVPPGVTDTALVEWLRVVREVRDKRPLTADELTFAQRSLIGRFLLTQVRPTADRALDVLQGGLPETFYTDYERRMNALTLSEVQAAAIKYFDADHLVIAIVGDRAKIEAPLRATGIPVVIVDH